MPCHAMSFASRYVLLANLTTWMVYDLPLRGADKVKCLHATDNSNNTNTPTQPPNTRSGATYIKNHTHKSTEASELPCAALLLGIFLLLPFSVTGRSRPNKKAGLRSLEKAFSQIEDWNQAGGGLI